MLTRDAFIVSARPADQYDGYYCLSVDNPAVFVFEALNCEPHEFAEWYLRRYDKYKQEQGWVEYKTGASLPDENQHEIWLWVDELDVVEGERLIITSDEAFANWLEAKVADHVSELNQWIWQQEQAMGLGDLPRQLRYQQSLESKTLEA
ncbi:hypothetical protein [Vibrio mediterranei]|uniref:Uncharacterized protein n=2 Tax=Gammaproteobacteria TaxID=1236 RepID=A0ABX5D6N5_9VIBR|nr:hypothetical protein [Vibrio mediterranei]PRQ65145.1 hypothetical protein COR51_23780 [Vibrio mediterranei]